MKNNTYLPSKPRFDILDGLRGVAAMMVVDGSKRSENANTKSLFILLGVEFSCKGTHYFGKNSYFGTFFAVLIHKKGGKVYGIYRLLQDFRC